jgi:sugar lactone lactonase YvrE
MQRTATPIIDGLVFPEALRWDGGKLWICDFHASAVLALETKTQTLSRVATYDADDLGGIGFLPDGRLLAVAQHERLVLQFGEGRESVYADLTLIADDRIGDMIVASDGTAYIGNRTSVTVDDSAELERIIVRYGSSDRDVAAHHGRVFPVICITSDGKVRGCLANVDQPNGMALSDDGTALFVTDTFRATVTVYQRRSDGSLGDGQLFARIAPAPGTSSAVADGICLDVENGVWAADPIGSRVVRIEAGGIITDTIVLPGEHRPTCCVLGGPDRQTLYVSSSSVLGRAAAQKARAGRISSVRVSIPGCGRP